MEEMLKVADKNQFAVGAFNATESSLFRAVVEEAEAQNAPAIVQVSSGFIPSSNNQRFLSVCKGKII